MHQVSFIIWTRKKEEEEVLWGGLAILNDARLLPVENLTYFFSAACRRTYVRTDCGCIKSLALLSSQLSEALPQAEAEASSKE